MLCFIQLITVDIINTMCTVLLRVSLAARPLHIYVKGLWHVKVLCVACGVNLKDNVGILVSDETSWLFPLCVKIFSVYEGICFDRLT